MGLKGHDSSPNLGPPGPDHQGTAEAAGELLGLAHPKDMTPAHMCIHLHIYVDVDMYIYTHASMHLPVSHLSIHTYMDMYIYI